MTIIELETNDMNKINFCLKMILHYLGTLNQCCPPMSIQCTITILTKKMGQIKIQLDIIFATQMTHLIFQCR